MQAGNPQQGAESRTQKEVESPEPPEVLSEHLGGELENGQLEPRVGIRAANRLPM